MKTNIGIVGYGNLGKAAEKQVLSNKNFNLIAIFSRRTVKSAYGTLIEPYDNIKLFQGKIDIMLLCGGSFNDLETQTAEILKYYNCINTFDNHQKISTELSSLNNIAKQHNHILIMSCGWDPGIFSVIRALMFSITKTTPTTFWGKGISMGHSDVIRQVDGVYDGIQFTIPNKKSLTLAKKGIFDSNIKRHFRECFVVAEAKNQPKIEYKIKNIPNYFKDQPTSVHFVSHELLLKLKNKLSHKGEVICVSKTTKSKLHFSVSMESNPEFTSNIIMAYINAVINLKKHKITGSFTPLDIPISFLFDDGHKNSLIEKFC